MKNMKKFLSVVLCMLMLSAMAIPAMAEGETVNKYDYTLNESFDAFTVSKTGIQVLTENGNSFLEIKDATTGSSNALLITGDKTKAISSAYYEVGFKVKLDKSVSKDFLVQIAGSNASYPVLNSKFTSGSDGDYYYQTNSKDVLINSETLSTGDWNDIRMKFVENHTDSTVTLDVYLNGNHITNLTYAFANITNANRDPYQIKVYPYDANSEGVYFDDMYIAQYTPVTSFSQEAVNISVAVGQEANFPSTVNVTADGVSETVNVLWEDVDTTTTGTKTVYGVMDGYSVDVKAVATVTVAEPAFPYELAIDGTTLTVTKAGSLTPEAKIYGAVYENGLLTDVQILGTVSGSTAWTDSKTTLSLDEGKVYRAFVVDDQLVPYAISTTLN